MEGKNDQSLLNAVANGKVRAVHNLLDSGANVNAIDGNLRTPLIKAVFIEKEDVRSHIVRMLLNHGCDVNAKDKNGRTALMHAAFEQGRQDVVRQLVGSKRCDPNVRDKNGDVSLTYAVIRNNSSAIRSIVNSAYTKSIVNVNSKNRDGLSPLQIAVNLRHGQCCQILVAEGGASTSEFAQQSILQKLLDAKEDTPLQSQCNEKAQSDIHEVIEKANAHTPVSNVNDGYTGTTIDDRAARKNDRKSYKSSVKNPDKVKNDISGDADCQFGAQIVVKEKQMKEPKSEAHHGHPLQKSGACNMAAQRVGAINRPTDQNMHFSVGLNEDFNVPEVIETISNYSLSPRPIQPPGHPRHSTSPLPVCSADMVHQRVHKNRNRTLSLDTKPLTELKTKPNLSDTSTRNQIPLNVKLQPITAMPNLDSSLLSQFDCAHSDELLFRRHSFDNRLHTHYLQNREENANLTKRDPNAVPRLPARLRPLSGSKDTKVPHLSLPHI